MAFSKEKLQPSNVLYTLLAPIVFDNVRSSSEHTTNRNRQCYKCMGQIEKGEVYVNHQFRYDKKIMSISFHKDCFNGFENEYVSSSPNYNRYGRKIRTVVKK